ncbi:MAG: aldehyde ferredoxin oxidoreductase C-terminal domain-containing protein [bacterium]
MRFIRINAAEGRITEEQGPDKYIKYGGRSLSSRIISDEVPATCHPLGPRNKLVIAAGLLGGTTAPCSGRISIGVKSPLTGGIKESNVGGNFGTYIARAGIRAIIFEGFPKDNKLSYLVIGAEGLSLEDASDYRGMGTYELAKHLREKHGQKAAILCVGPAGEQRLAASAIMSTDLDGNPSRAAARGGPGAVLASKGIKAVVALPVAASNARYTNEIEFKKIAREFGKLLIETKGGLTKLGTAAMVAAADKLGGMPTHNYKEGSFAGAKEMSGEKLFEVITERGGMPTRSCHTGCVIRCSNVFKTKSGEYVTGSLEYETMVLVGSNLGISDLDSIAMIDRTLDDLGLDSIDTGVALGIAMEQGLLKWGDAEGVIALLNEVRVKTAAGKLIGSGAAVVGKVLGAHRVAEVKGQATVAYDPRTFKGMGCSFATSPMGADHTSGPAIPGRIGLDPDKKFELTEAEGQAELSRDLQIMITVVDSMGYCFFVGPDMANMSRTAALLNALYGWDMKFEDVLDIGISTLNVEKRFNRDAGISEGADRLPDFFYDEPLPPTGRTFDIPREDLRGLDYNLK